MQRNDVARSIARADTFIMHIENGVFYDKY